MAKFSRTHPHRWEAKWESDGYQCQASIRRREDWPERDYWVAVAVRSPDGRGMSDADRAITYPAARALADRIVAGLVVMLQSSSAP